MLKVQLRRAVAIALAAVTFSALLPNVGMAGDDNDNASRIKKQDTTDPVHQTLGPSIVAPALTLEYEGFNSPNNDQLIKFKVKNVGSGASTATVTRVVTSTPEPTPWLRELTVEALASGASVEIFYPLAASCDGHVVRALLVAPPGSTAENVTIEKQVCPSKAASGSTGSLITPVDENDQANTSAPLIETSLIPEYQRPGEHTGIEFKPTLARRHALYWKDESLIGCSFPSSCRFDADDEDVSVGWEYVDLGGKNTNAVYQLIVNFDVSWLRDLDKKLIFSAEMLFDEQGITARDNDGDAIPLGPCSGQLGLAPRNWQQVIARTGDDGALITTQDVNGAAILGGWDVTEDIRTAARKDLANQWQGFVLHSANEYIGAESDGACLSTITNIRLKLHYLVD